MERRDFLKLAGYTGMGLLAPVAPALAKGEPYEGLFFVQVHASGGWDPTSLCDPKGMVTETENDPMNRYFRDDIESAGSIRYAPIPGLREFFQKHHQKLLVVNGVDSKTNGHDSGTRHTWSGQLAEGHPTFGAMAAGALGPDRPLAFVAFGGYDRTMGIVAPTRTGNTAVLSRIAFPERIDPANRSSLYNSNETLARIKRLSDARLSARMAKETLPSRRAAMSSLMLARAGENDIKRLTEHLPANLDASNNRLRRQAQLAVAAYKAGVCVSANMAQGGFDTHGNHDMAHWPRLRTLMEGVDFLFDEADRQGVADKMVVMVCSDFGRTPGYNTNNGKDHWSVTSALLAGPGIKGNRVVGETTERHRPKKVNAQTLAVDETGIRISPAHIHRALRKLAGIHGTELDRTYPIRAEEIPLFG